MIEPSTSASANVFSFRVCHELFKQKNPVVKKWLCRRERERERERADKLLCGLFNPGLGFHFPIEVIVAALCSARLCVLTFFGNGNSLHSILYNLVHLVAVDMNWIPPAIPSRSVPSMVEGSTKRILCEWCQGHRNLLAAWSLACLTHRLWLEAVQYPALVDS